MTYMSEMTGDIKVKFFRAYFLNYGISKHTQYNFWADLLAGV